MLVRPTVVLLGLALLLLAVPGCGNVCDQMCEAQADMLARCLDSWDTSWEELSYGSEDDFLERCHVVYGDALDDLESGESDAVRLETRCSQDLQTAESDIDCQSLLSIDP